MLSSDQNVESIAQLIEVVKKYIVLQKEYVKLDVTEKLVRLLTALALTVIFFSLLAAVLFYLSLAVAHWLQPLVGIAMAYFIVAMAFLLLIIMFFVFRKAWIERPLVRFFGGIILRY